MFLSPRAATNQSASATPPSSLVLSSSSPLTSWFSRSLFSMSAASSASSFSVTALGAIFTVQSPPAFEMLALISSMACSSVEIPAFLSRHCEVRTKKVSFASKCDHACIPYRGGDTSLTLTCVSWVFFASAHLSAVLTASMPSYPKHVTAFVSHIQLEGSVHHTLDI